MASATAAKDQQSERGRDVLVETAAVDPLLDRDIFAAEAFVTFGVELAW